MNPVDMVLHAIAITMILLFVTIALLVIIELAEVMGYKIPNWVKKLKK